MRARSSIPAPFLALVITTACFPVSGPAVGPAQIRGPSVALVVTNRTNENRVIGYEFEAESTAGGGEGEVPCGRTVILFGELVGSYVILADGQPVAEGQVPAAARAGTFLVFRIEIDEEGSASAMGPDVRAQPPDEQALIFENCG